MFWNEYELERAALADNLPAIIEALIACPSNEMTETPGWATRIARNWIIRLMRETNHDGRVGLKYLRACREDMIHARRFDMVEEVLEQQIALPQQVREWEEVIEKRRANPKRREVDLTPRLRERELYLKSVGQSLGSACEVAGRLLESEGLRPVSASAILRSYKLVRDQGPGGRYYTPQSAAVMAVFRLLGILRPRSNIDGFEEALLGENYSKLRASKPFYKADWGDSSPRIKKPPEFISFPWALDSPNGDHDHPFEGAVRAGNVLAVVSGLHMFNRGGGLAPSWLLQSGAWWIIALLKRQGATGERSVLTTCAQRLLDCERYLFIEQTLEDRQRLALKVRGECDREGLSVRAKAEKLRSLGLQHAASLDAAIRETLAVLRGTPLELEFEAAKKAFRRIEGAPHLLDEHWLPPEYVARQLGLLIFVDEQKVGNEYPPSGSKPLRANLGHPSGTRSTRATE